MEGNFCPNCEDEPEFKGAEIYTNYGFNEPPASEKKIYAGFWIRFVAYVIDTIIIGIVCLVVVSFSFMLMGSGSWIEVLAYIFCIFFSWLYFACQESSSKQATIGKRAFGLLVTDPEYRRISFGRATVRWIAKILSALVLYIGFIMIGFTRRKQGLHGMVAGTYVCDKSRV